MKEVIKSVGAIALGLAILVGVLVLALLFINGGVWLGDKIYPSLFMVSVITFLVCLFILIPMAVFHPTRGIAGLGLFISSYILGLLLWVSGLLLTYTIWGGLAVLVGLFAFGVGVVPIALLATLIKGLWSAFGTLWLLIAATYGSRFMATYVIGKHDESQYMDALPSYLQDDTSCDRSADPFRHNTTQARLKEDLALEARSILEPMCESFKSSPDGSEVSLLPTYYIFDASVVTLLESLSLKLVMAGISEVNVLVDELHSLVITFFEGQLTKRDVRDAFSGYRGLDPTDPEVQVYLAEIERLRNEADGLIKEQEAIGYEEGQD